MKFLDRFLNTYAKRVLLVYFVMIMWLIYYHYQNATLGYALFHVEDVDGLYTILNMNCMSQIIIGRLVSAYLSFSNTAGGLIFTILSVFNLPLVLFMFLIGIYWFHGLEEPIFERGKWHLLFVIVAQWLVILVVFGLGIMALHSKTALMAIQIVNIMGIVIGVAQIVFTLIHLYMAFDTLYQFQERA